MNSVMYDYNTQMLIAILFPVPYVQGLSKKKKKNFGNTPMRYFYVKCYVTMTSAFYMEQIAWYHIS